MAEATLAQKVAYLSRPEAYGPGSHAVACRETHMSWVFSLGRAPTSSRSRFDFLTSIFPRRRGGKPPAKPKSSSIGASRPTSISKLRASPRLYPQPVRVHMPHYPWAGPARSLIGSSSCAVLTSARRSNTRSSSIPSNNGNWTAWWPHSYNSTGVPRRSRSRLRSICRIGARASPTITGYFLNLDLGYRRAWSLRSDEVQRRFLAQRRELLVGRVLGRRIVDGHGDLRPEHIWLGDPVRIIDCLEFNDRLRAGDPLDEIAFLSLECERLGAAWAGEWVRRRVMRGLYEDVPEALFWFYRCHRATLRARLAIAHLLEPNPRTPEKWPQLARSYLEIAASDARKLACWLRLPAR